MNASICSCNSATVVNDAPLSDWFWRMENQVSIWLSHDDRVGMKWKWTFGRFFSQRSHFLWVFRLSRMTWRRMRGNGLPGGDFQHCKQGGGAVPLVIVALAGQG